MIPGKEKSDRPEIKERKRDVGEEGAYRTIRRKFIGKTAKFGSRRGGAVEKKKVRCNEKR